MRYACLSSKIHNRLSKQFNLNEFKQNPTQIQSFVRACKSTLNYAFRFDHHRLTHLSQVSIQRPQRLHSMSTKYKSEEIAQRLRHFCPTTRTDGFSHFTIPISDKLGHRVQFRRHLSLQIQQSILGSRQPGKLRTANELIGSFNLTNRDKQAAPEWGSLRIRSVRDLTAGRVPAAAIEGTNYSR